MYRLAIQPPSTIHAKDANPKKPRSTSIPRAGIAKARYSVKTRRKNLAKGMRSGTEYVGYALL
jgi:hypothetical protein